MVRGHAVRSGAESGGHRASQPGSSLIRRHVRRSDPQGPPLVLQLRPISVQQRSLDVAGQRGRGQPGHEQQARLDQGHGLTGVRSHDSGRVLQQPADHHEHVRVEQLVSHRHARSDHAIQSKQVVLRELSRNPGEQSARRSAVFAARLYVQPVRTVGDQHSGFAVLRHQSVGAL